jgi:hypothetical protein
VAMMVEWEEVPLLDGASVDPRSVLKGVPCLPGVNLVLATDMCKGPEKAAQLQPARFRP